ncbi:hypothetical protein OESDEN_09413 [Oesophagostomum dentatum]|uniref:Uncharacterized protein n=1 Tax=Oesophagostomum dentatum TaxID=61180 RepID=A0A0B1T3L8_OESDE|nr:hypothetical protein OESDEN_09413 [Oesophagostomum dentatum]
MSRAASKSPESETRAFVSDDGHAGSADGGRLSFSTPMTASIPPIEVEVEEAEREKDKKWSRKSLEEHKPKRKETTTSFSSFLHRFTRSEDKKEDKQKSVINEEDSLDRPDKLQVPDSEEKWYEMKTMDGGFRTAVDMGNEAGAPIYEWKTDSLEETLLTEFKPSHKELLRVEHSDPELDDLERSMLKLLEEFRSGQMRALTDEQMQSMRAMKKEHEDVTNLHLALYNLDKTGSEKSEDELDVMYDKLSQKLLCMHDCMPAFVHGE